MSDPGATVGAARPMLRTRLSFMMFLQYAIWGAWLPILYPFLLGHRGFSLDQVGAILGAGAIGAIFGPFIAGQIADRHFATERFLGISHITGAILVWFLATVDSFGLFLGLSVIYGLIYAPTLALTNSLTFHHIEDRDRDFGPIRLWGTIGWIVAGILVGQWLLLHHTPEAATATAEMIAAEQDAGRADAFRLSAVLGVILGLYCFTLPHTPPQKGKQPFAVGEALCEIRKQPLVTLFLISVPISMIHQFYFVYTAQFLSQLQRGEATEQFVNLVNTVFGVGGGGLMTIGQMSEIAVLALIPLVAKKVARKWLLCVGILAYAARMAIFAYAGDSMPAVIVGIAMHGLCFGCFIFVAFMVVDEQSSGDVRATAQNLFNLVFVGLGIAVGSWVSTSIVGEWAKDAATETMDWTKLFSVPMWASLACLVLMLMFYPARSVKRHPE